MSRSADMDDTQRIVKCGCLALHTPGGLFKKRWPSRYLVLYDGSKSGIKRLELFDSEIKFKKQQPAKIIPLVDCIRVVTCQRNKTTYTFEVRTSEQLYLLAAHSFQDMTDWVNCLRLVAFGRPQPASPPSRAPPARDVLLDKRPAGQQPQVAAPGSERRHEPEQLAGQINQRPASASQAAAAAATALAKTRQRQPSLVGACKPQPPRDSPFVQAPAGSPAGATPVGAVLSAIGQVYTMTPSVRGQLIGARQQVAKAAAAAPALDEEEENMLYCSIEDNPAEHNYRVKVIETELSVRCQLKSYQLTAPTTVSQQYAQLGQPLALAVTFYQLIVGPQELTLLNDYAAAAPARQQQGLWSWPYQCIRRYGFDKDNCFMFEAGRKCGSGPGQFVVQTPKAYAIYQDVVKSVNELRTLGSAPDAPSAAAAAKTVTQIPVSWAPDAAAKSEAQEQGDSRQHFFDALRQLDAGAPKAADPKPAPAESSAPATSAEPETQARVAAPEAAAKSEQSAVATGAKTKSVNSPEETDESGYEQGDDSVDSSRSRPKGGGGGLRARPPPDSMSSSASTSSASSGGSPGHSAARRAGLAGCKRPPLSKSLAPEVAEQAKGGEQGAGLHRMMIGSVLGPDDFESNLMRDVYSEISKLHAKFAVTSAGSAEESLSGSESCGSSEATDNSGARDEPDEEPMYSNLRLGQHQQRVARAGKRSQQVSSRDAFEDDEYYEQVVAARARLRQRQQQQPARLGGKLMGNRFIQEQQQQQLTHQDYLSHRPAPVFPTPLNPIPECGEPTVQSARSAARAAGSSPERPRQVSAGETARPLAQRQLNRRPPGQPAKSRLSTNHYVINDVQYAKISRNIHSKLNAGL